MTKVFCDLSGTDITKDDKYYLVVEKRVNGTNEKHKVLKPLEISGAELVALKEYLAERERRKENGC